MLWYKNWYWLLALLVVIGIRGYVLLKPKPPVTLEKVHNKPELNKVRKAAPNKGMETFVDPITEDNTENDEISDVFPDEPSETTAEPPTDNIYVESVEDIVQPEETPKAVADDWRTADYGESPFGFGEYPKIPSDLPNDYRPGWTMSNVAEQREEIQASLRAWELLDRSRIKLWNEGHTEVTTIDLSPITNKIYPLSPTTVLVKYTGTGIDKRVSSVFTDSDFPEDLAERIKFGERPPGILILDYDTDGFDVYEFLGL